MLPPKGGFSAFGRTGDTDMIAQYLADGIVLEAKGFWVIGLLKVIVEAVKNIILNAQLESRLRNS